MKPKKRAYLKVIITLLLLGVLIHPHIAVGADQNRDVDLQNPTEPSRDLSVVDFDEGDPAINVIEINPFFTIAQYTLDDGTPIYGYNIAGPPKPPEGFEAERTASIMPLPSRGTLADFPAYDWVYGCSAVAGGIIAGYYDRQGYPDLYTGPTNGGVMPLSDTVWPYWADGKGDAYRLNPLVASKAGLDGRSEYGSIDNYWVSNNSTADDPYITHSWDPHPWGSAIGDYMKTSQSAWPYQSRDGNTWFWNYGDATKLTCSAMEQFIPPGETYTISENDGTYGRKLFYEARGYTVTDCFNQRTDNQAAGGFSLADFQAEIDAGHPVLLNLAGHSIVGYGYSGSTIFIRDTWDSNPNNTFTMPWGGSYAGMVLRSVSVVRLAPTIPVTPAGVVATNGFFNYKVRISWTASSGASYYQVFRNTRSNRSGEKTLTSDTGGSPYDDETAVLGQLYYYWVKACNAAGCSDYSAPATGQVGDFSIIEVFLPLMVK
ncbi:MAG: hypothetical protein ACNA70_09330 [Brevefilum sp.]